MKLISRFYRLSLSAKMARHVCFRINALRKSQLFLGKILRSRNWSRDHNGHTIMPALKWPNNSRAHTLLHSLRCSTFYNHGKWNLAISSQHDSQKCKKWRFMQDSFFNMLTGSCLISHSYKTVILFPGSAPESESYQISSRRSLYSVARKRFSQ